MKKESKIILIALFSLLFISLLGVIIYKLYFNNDKYEKLFYSYEGNGKFIMSSTAHKVSNYKDLNNNYFIKEHITKINSKVPVVEVLYSEGPNEPYNVYGFYTEEEFNKYFSSHINDGMVCDGNTEFNLGEGFMMKCVLHEKGYNYDNIDSELCANIDNTLVCIKPNDWDNIENYKNKFKDAGWQCEYYDYTTGEWSDNDIPLNGNLECSKEKPSTRQSDYIEGLFCFIGNDGSAICNDNIGWCGIGNDLNTWCTGVN